MVGVGQGKASWSTTPRGDLVPTLLLRGLSLPTLYLGPSLPLLLPPGFPLMSIRFCFLSPFISLCLDIMFPSFFFFCAFFGHTFPLSLSLFFPSSTFPSSYSFSCPSFFLSYLILPSISFFILSFYFFSFPFLSLSSSLLLLICSYFPSLCILSAFVHHKTNQSCLLILFFVDIPAPFSQPPSRRPLLYPTPALPQH